MELYTMEYVLAVADCGNFSQAARICHVGQPALSQQVAKLERELGTPLFTRGPRGASLTEAGRVFAERAREILQKTRSLETEMGSFAGLRKGTLALGVITSLQCIDFGGLISAFCETYPGVSLTLSQASTRELVGLVLGRELDMAFINDPTGGLSEGLDFQKLGEDTYSLAVPVSHPLAGRGQVSLRELKGERFIFHQAGQTASDLCWNACRRAGFQPDIVCRSGSPTIGMCMVRGGMGVAFLPSEEFVTHRVDGVAEVRLREPIVKEVGIIWRRDAASPLVKTLREFAAAWCEREK